tara:strand:- start:23 stop:1063 length:1041 start_codon:yes stop_codon:yes gene_type:complete
MGIARQAVELGIKGVKEATPAIQKYVTETFGEAKQNLFSSMAKNNHPKYLEITQDLDTLTKSTDESVREALGYNVHQKLDGVFAEGERLNTASTVTSIPQGTSVKTQVPTSESVIRDFPVQARNVDTDRPNFISETDAKARNKAMKAAGITSYQDELGHSWSLEGGKQWRNTVTRGATKKTLNPFTGEIGTRLASTKRYVNKRLRGLAASSPEEAKYIAEIEKTKADINKRLNLKKDDPNFMTIEHRIAQNNWKKWNLPGNPHDSANLWLSTKYEAGIKTKIENILRTRKRIKNRYVVDFNPEDNALHIMEFDKFKLNEAPTGKAFKKVDGKYDWDAINEYLNTLE